jgi:hypothetical protein
MRNRIFAVLSSLALAAAALGTSVAAAPPAAAATCTYAGGSLQAYSFTNVANVYDYVVFGFATLPGCALGTITAEAVPQVGSVATPAPCPPQVFAVNALGDDLAECATFRAVGGVGVGTVHLTIFGQIVGVGSSGTRVVRTGTCMVTLTPTVGSGGSCAV